MNFIVNTARDTPLAVTLEDLSVMNAVIFCNLTEMNVFSRPRLMDQSHRVQVISLPLGK